jgi:Holliday junction resolvase RusA-like endonuclease
MADRFEFIGTPVAKPRMTRADRYKKRPVVEKYWAFKDKIILQAKKQKFVLGRAYKVTFYMPLPKSISAKEKAKRLNKPHVIRPDLDNMLKSLNDTLMDEDSGVFYVTCQKKWAEEGKIIVENLPENLDF